MWGRIINPKNKINNTILFKIINTLHYYAIARTYSGKEICKACRVDIIEKHRKGWVNIYKLNSIIKYPRRYWWTFLLGGCKSRICDFMLLAENKEYTVVLIFFIWERLMSYFTLFAWNLWLGSHSMIFALNLYWGILGLYWDPLIVYI